MLKKPFSIAREIIEEALTRAHSKISMTGRNLQEIVRLVEIHPRK